MKVIRVQIEAIDDEGRGRASYADPQGNRFDVAARGAFIDDDVLVTLERFFTSLNLWVGRATKFFGKGPCHVERNCPHDAPCAACPLHGAEPSLAIEIKRGRIERALEDEGLHFAIEDLVPHPHTFGYRQKVKLMAEFDGERLHLGVFVPYSHRFVVAEQCPYVDTRINEAISKLLCLLNKAPIGLERIKAMILRAAQEGVCAIVVTTAPLTDDTAQILEKAVASGVLLSVSERVQSHATNSILAGEQGRRYGPEWVLSLEGGPPVDPDSFCQSDPEQARFMYDFIARFLVQKNPAGTFVDAYAGVGGFTRALLRAGAHKIIAVELSPSARHTLTALPVEVILAPMAEALTALGRQKPFEGIVVDPPKKGLVGDGEALAQLGAQRVALVSCDPDAMAKDLKVFLANGYQVERIVPVDFFGGTPAIETLVLMTRASH